MSRRPSHLFAFVFVVSALGTLALAQISKAQPAEGMAPAPMTAPMAAPPPAMTAEGMAAPAATAPAAMAAPVAPAAPMAVVAPIVAVPEAPPPMAVPVEEAMAAAPPVGTVPAEVGESFDPDLGAVPVVATATTVKTAPAAPAATAAAPVVKTTNWWQTLLGGVIQLVLLIVAGIAAPLGVLLVRLLAKKAKISDAEQQHVMEGLVTNAISIGINYATQISNKLNNSPDAKAQRIKWATDKAAEVLREYGIADKTGKWIADRIEAQLGMINGAKPAAVQSGVVEIPSTRFGAPTEKIPGPASTEKHTDGQGGEVEVRSGVVVEKPGDVTPEAKPAEEPKK